MALVGLEQRQYGEAEGVLHARSPVAVELAAEDAQGVGGGLIAIPAESDVEQVDAERPPPVRHVQVDDVRLARARHQSERGHRQVAMRVDQHQRRGGRRRPCIR